MKQILILLSVFLPLITFSQSFNVGVIAAYQKSNLKQPSSKTIEYKSVNEYNLGIFVTKQFKKKIGVNFNLNLNNLWLVSETKDLFIGLGFDPEKDIKYTLNYLNLNIKLLYCKNNPVDGLSVGIGTFMYLFQTKNYDISYEFDDYNKFYNTLSLGYYCYPIKNLMAEFEFVSNITALGDATFNGFETKWEDKYWKYGLRFSVLYNFLSLPKNKEK